ncbi:MAG: GerMN domain-containing protein [Deltaproteobacteria bacterium]|nr:GerMN domain-containing protein [Deltaproteobacteria bacterium]
MTIIAAIALFIGAAGFLAYRYLAPEAPGVEEDSEAGPRRFRLEPDNVVQRARVMVSALIDGPKAALTPTLPAETKLLALHVTDSGTAYVDFSRVISEKHPGGSLSELLTIFSVVNTLSLNIPEIKAVKILIEGREAKTLAGHIDIRFPFRPNLLMVK